MRLNVCFFFDEMVPFGPFAAFIKRIVARMRGMAEMEVSSQEEMDENSCVTFLLCDPGWYVQRT